MLKLLLDQREIPIKRCSDSAGLALFDGSQVVDRISTYLSDELVNDQAYIGALKALLKQDFELRIKEGDAVIFRSDGQYRLNEIYREISTLERYAVLIFTKVTEVSP